MKIGQKDIWNSPDCKSEFFIIALIISPMLITLFTFKKYKVIVTYKSLDLEILEIKLMDFNVTILEIKLMDFNVTILEIKLMDFNVTILENKNIKK